MFESDSVLVKYLHKIIKTVVTIERIFLATCVVSWTYILMLVQKVEKIQMRTLLVIFQQLFTQAQTHLSIILNAAQIFYGCASSTLQGKRYYIVYICACIARTLSAVLSVKMSVEHIANFNCAPFTFSPVFILFFL